MNDGIQNLISDWIRLDLIAKTTTVLNLHGYWIPHNIYTRLTGLFPIMVMYSTCGMNIDYPKHKSSKYAI